MAGHAFADNPAAIDRTHGARHHVHHVAGVCLLISRRFYQQGNQT